MLSSIPIPVNAYYSISFKLFNKIIKKKFVYQNSHLSETTFIFYI